MIGGSPISLEEKPLAGSTRLLLIASTTAVMLLAYLFFLSALAWIILLMLFEVIIYVGGARFGAGLIMIGPLRALNRLAGLIVRSLIIRPDADMHIELPRSAAPQLFEMVERVAKRMGAGLPDSIVLHMGASPWVRLFGYRPGRGRYILGISYGDLAVLTKGEIEASIAHEMGHVAYGQRGYGNWLTRGVWRLGQLASSLESLVQEAASKRKKLYTASTLLKGVNVIGEAGSRLVSRFGRQEEFMADRVAAEICGSKTYRDALIHGCTTSLKSGRLAWRDYLIRMQFGESLSEWLRSNLTPKDEEERAELERVLLEDSRQGQFDTHPSLANRLAILPECPSKEASDDPAISLLKEPDWVAERLIKQIERTITEQESQEEAEARKELRKHIQGKYRLTFGQAFGGVTAIIGFLSFVIFLSLTLIYECPAHVGVRWMSLSVAVIAAGSLISWRYKYKDRVPLPVPAYWTFREAMISDLKREDVSTWLAAIESEMKARLPAGLGSRRARADYWAERAYSALVKCDYQRALVASQFCLADSKHHHEGLLAHSIATAYFGLHAESNQSMNHIFGRYGVTPSTSWGFGWAFTLLDDWSDAASYLMEAIARNPVRATMLTLLGIGLWECGKTRAALDRVRRAVSMEPSDHQQRVFLMQMFLSLGQPSDAQKELEMLEEHLPDDRRVMLGWVRLSFMQGKVVEAQQRADLLEKAYPDGETFLDLGRAYSEAEMSEKAEHCYGLSCQEGYCPDALVGLAYISYERKDYDAALANLLASIDMTRQPIRGGSKPTELLEAVFQGLISMEEKAERCQAYITHVDMNGAALGLQKVSLIVYGPTTQEAWERAYRIAAAMLPNHDLSARVTWEHASQDNQPDEPVAPGIHGWQFA